MRCSLLLLLCACICYFSLAEIVELVHIEGDSYNTLLAHAKTLGYEILEINSQSHTALIRFKHASGAPTLFPHVFRIASSTERIEHQALLPAVATYPIKLLLWQPLGAQHEALWHHDVELRVVRRTDAEPSVVLDMPYGSSSQARRRAYEYLVAHYASTIRAVELSWNAPRLLDATGNYVLQSYQSAVCNASSPFVGCTRTWDAGLDGSAQVLGVGDSGVNMRHCYFNDAACPASDDAAKPPACGGSGSSYLEQPCSNCVGYCASSLTSSCVPTPSTHRTVKAFRAANNDYLDRTSQHGTAVCSVATGSPDTNSASWSNAAYQNRGAAPAARLAFVDLGAEGSATLSVPTPMDTQYFPWFVAQGAFISTHSWGSQTSNGYNSETQAIDRFTYNNPHHLVVFAAGNAGNAQQFGQYLLLGAESSSKNALAVGATMTERAQVLMFPSFASRYNTENATRWSARYLAGFSSTGPTLDRRIKPDIVAPGLLTLAALEDAPRANTVDGANCAFPSAVAGWSGTSFSAPLVAGYAVLLRQWLVGGGYRSIALLPSAALLKAMLVTSARPLDGIHFYDEGKVQEYTELEERAALAPFGSRYAWGHGRPLVDPLLAQNGANTFLFDSLSTSAPINALYASGEEVALCVRSTSLNVHTRLSVALAYTDFPASLPTSYEQARASRLVNDLDLWSVDATCTPHFANGLEAAMDRLNNVERLMLPVVGTTTTTTWHVVVVRAEKLVVAPQHYALAFTHHHHGSDATLSVQPFNMTYDAAHPCAQIYSNCNAVFSEMRNLDGGEAMPPPPPSTSTSDAATGLIISHWELLLHFCVCVLLFVFALERFSL